MPEIVIRLSVPEGTVVTVAGIEGATVEPPEPGDERHPVERYWHDYLSDNGRKVYGQAARREEVYEGEFTLEDIAGDLSLPYETIKSMHRSTGRAAKRWRRETGTEEPISLVATGYEWIEEMGGARTLYALAPGVAQRINDLEAS